MTTPIRRRTLLKLAGAAAAGPALVACGDGNGGDKVSSAGKDLAPWPSYLPFAGPKPDQPGNEAGVQPLYLNYPQQTVQSVQEAPGDGSKVTALVITYGTPPKPLASNQYWQAVQKAMNVELDLTIVPDPEYTKKMTTLMASGGDLPDIIFFSNAALPNREEFIVRTCTDLSDLVSGDAVKEYPNLANIPRYAWEGMGRFGGKIYGIPLERPMPSNTLFVNRTAMDAAGIPREWNTEQFVSGVTKLTGGRRWGIGWNKTLFVGNAATQFHAGSLGAPNTWTEQGGAFTSTYTTPQFEEALGVLNRIAQARAHYPDSLSISVTDIKNHFWNGTVLSYHDGFGAVNSQTTAGINNRFAAELARPYGPSPAMWRSTGNFGFAAFRKAKPDRIKMLLRICNYLAAPFGTKEYELNWYGVEGVHYTKDSGGLKTTELYKVENNTNLPTKYIANPPNVLFLPGYPEFAQSVYEWEKAVLPTSSPNPANGLRTETATSKGAQLDQIIGDGIAAVVFGRKPMSAWKDVVSQWRQAGGDQLAEEYAKEYAAAK